MSEVVASNRAVRGKLILLFPEPVYAGFLLLTLASQIEGKIRQWIAVKSKKAVPGDVINIVVCGHGDPRRLGFYAGYHRIFPFEMDRLLGKFKPGVTVNVISGSVNSVEDEGCESQTARTERPKPRSE